MRPRRLRGLGCLGCLPFGGLLLVVIPLVAIGAVIYFLVNRQNAATPAQYTPTTPPAGGGFCPQCGKPMSPGTAFCANCGAKVG